MQGYKGSSDLSNSKKCQSGADKSIWKVERMREKQNKKEENRKTFSRRTALLQESRGKKDHIVIQMYTQREIPERTDSDHNPLPPPPLAPPPPTQGRTSQRPKRVSQFRPRTTDCTPPPPIPSLEFTSSLFLSASVLCSRFLLFDRCFLFLF